MIHTHLIIAAQAAGLGEPAKGSLYNPTLGQNLETFSSVTTAHNLQAQLTEGAKLLNPLNQGTQVAAIGPNDLDSSVHTYQKPDQTLGGRTVLHCGGGDHNGQNQSQAVHRQVAFAPQHLFARVVAAFSGLVAGSDRLAVHNSCRRRDLSLFGLAQPVSQGVVNEPPSPVLGPLSKVAIDRLPPTQIPGQQPPGATRANDVENGIDQTATLQRDRSSAFSFSRLRRRNERFDVVPFFISQVSWITSWMRLHPFHLYYSVSCF